MKTTLGGLSGAEKALAAAGLGALAVVTGTPSAGAATTTLHLTAGNTASFDVDGNTANGKDIRIFAYYAGWWLVSSMNSVGVAFASGLPRGGGATTGTGAKNFAGTGAISGWTGAWGHINAWTGQIWDPNNSTNYGAGYWQDGVMAYLGFRVPLGGGGYSYGWIQITPSDTGDTLTISDYHAAGASGGAAAGGGPGGAAGAPEPAAAGLGLLALGAAGVVRRKRQKRAA